MLDQYQGTLLCVVNFVMACLPNATSSKPSRSILELPLTTSSG
jgi:hypothetical protein